MQDRYVPKLSRDEEERRRLAAGKELLARAGEYGAKAEIARKYGVSTAAIAQWSGILKTKGLDGLRRSTNKPGFPTRLDDEQKAALAQFLIEGATHHGFEDDIWTGPRIARLIKREFGVEYAPKYVPTLLKDQLGFTWQKPARRPREIDSNKVDDWLRNQWQAAKKGRSRKS